ncbi:MAG: glycosyltransferase family 2 protein [Chloroflexota bacterium]|nr:glycosyltransferase family 2 protein [Chloroflexota bacterium]
MELNRTVVALIPAWNEGSRLGPVVEATRHYLPVLVVDDGSTDDTATVAERAGATVVSHVCNQGKGVALMTGFDWALQRDYDGVLTLDADGQHDPDDIPLLLGAYQTEQWDLIIGRRRFDQMPFPRGYTNPFGSWLLSLALGEPIPDNQSGFRLHDRRLLEILELTATGFELEVELIVQAICRGMRIGWVEIRTIYGIDKTSYFHPLKDSARFLGMVWHAWRRRRSTISSR